MRPFRCPRSDLRVFLLASALAALTAAPPAHAQSEQRKEQKAQMVYKPSPIPIDDAAPPVYPSAPAGAPRQGEGGNIGLNMGTGPGHTLLPALAPALAPPDAPSPHGMGADGGAAGGYAPLLNLETGPEAAAGSFPGQGSILKEGAEYRRGVEEELEDQPARAEAKEANTGRMGSNSANPPHSRR